MVNQIFARAQQALPFASQRGRLIPGYSLRYADSWKSITKSAPEAVSGMGMFMPVFAYMASKEAPGERLASFAPEVIGVGTAFLMTPAVTMAMHMIPGFGMLPPGVRSFAGVMTEQFVVNNQVTERLGRVIRQANQYTKRTRSFEMGSSFQDSRNAASMRLAAMQDMSAAFGASRRYLGNEARLLHG